MKIRAQMTDLGIAKDLSLDLSKPENLTDEVVHRVQDHMIEMRAQNIPYGLHAFGRTPSKELRETTIDAIVSTDRSLLPDKKQVLAEEMVRFGMTAAWAGDATKVAGTSAAAEAATVARTCRIRIRPQSVNGTRSRGAVWIGR